MLSGPEVTWILRPSTNCGGWCARGYWGTSQMFPGNKGAHYVWPSPMPTRALDGANIWVSVHTGNGRASCANSEPTMALGWVNFLSGINLREWFRRNHCWVANSRAQPMAIVAASTELRERSVSCSRSWGCLNFTMRRGAMAAASLNRRRRR